MILKAVLFIVSLLPFAATIGSGVAAQTELGQFYKHIYGIFAVVFFTIGIGVHGIAPVFLYDLYYTKPENRWKRKLFWIAPVITGVVSLAIFFHG